MEKWILLMYGFFAGHSLFLAAWLTLNHKNSGNRLLGLILLLLTARVSKSILSLAFASWGIPVNVVGLVSMAALGPIVFLYFKDLYSTPSRSRKEIVLHLIPATLCLGLWSWTLISVGYYVITIQLIVYLICITMMLVRNADTYSVDNIRWRWGKGVLGGLVVISISFVLQILVYAPVFYLANVGVSVIVLYLLSWWALKENRIFVESVKKNGNVEPGLYIELGERVKKLMDEELFIDPDLNLSKLAKRLGVPPYRLSRAINSYFSMSFPELILGYRIRKAERLLSSFNKFYTIEAIAYESGFNTLSVFYQAFKKTNGMTPAQHRKRIAGNGNARAVSLD